MTYEPRGTQVDVIASTAPVLVVRGGAGTGKTTTAVAAARAHLDAADLVLREARRAAALSGRRKRLPAPQRALFLSFSRTAVTQILDRAGPVIGAHGPRLEVATFHGFAWRIVNDFGKAHGHPQSAIISAANSKVPGAPPGLTYDRLLPAARELLAIPKVSDHYAGRYGIVICDEFQDTDASEWAFLQAIAPAARRILLGDVNQCIYSGFKSGVDPAARIAAALTIPGAVAVDLPAASHRDPTGVLPAAADAARQRKFNDGAIHAAASSGRLVITRVAEGDSHSAVVELARHARQQGHTVSIFTHTNAATGDLSDALSRSGLTHEQVGFGEAYGEALAAQLALVQYALGADVSPRRPMAVYLAACHGGRGLPPLARQLLDKSNPAMERAVDRLAADLIDAGGAEDHLTRIATVVSATWARVGTTRGQETWTQAAKRTSRVLRTATDRTIAAVTAELLRARDDALVGNHTARQRPIQVMNLHQTKGREADTTILLLGSDEFHGYESEPFPAGSRLLYVVMTRARRRAHIVVPRIAHPLWSPLVVACEAAGTAAAVRTA